MYVVHIVLFIHDNYTFSCVTCRLTAIARICKLSLKIVEVSSLDFCQIVPLCLHCQNCLPASSQPYTENNIYMAALATSLAEAFTASTSQPYTEEQYQALSAVEKHDLVWNLIDGTKGTVGQGTLGLAMVTSGFVASHDFSMEHYGDEMKPGRRKFIHQTGLVAQVRFDTAGCEHPFTGLFQGAEHCLVRCSLARRSPPGTSEKVTATPGIGLKIFRDQTHSGNMVAMYGVDGQHSWNFFRYPLITSVGEATAFKTKLLGKAFAKSGTFPGRVGMSDFASVDSSGTHHHDATNFPFVIEFHPPNELVERFGDEMSDDMLQDKKNAMAGHNHMKHELATLKPGDTMFIVKGWPDPWIKERGAAPITIGKLILKTEFIESSYCDDHLFFKHQRYEEDFVLRPSWGCPAWYVLNQNGVTEALKEQAEQIATALQADGQKDGIIKTNSYHMRAYPNTMVGTEVVAWMIAKKFTKDVAESVLMGRLIVASGVLRHTTRAHNFENKHLFYTFDAVGHSSVCPVKWRRLTGSVCPMHAKHNEFDPVDAHEQKVVVEGAESGETKNEKAEVHLTVAKLHNTMAVQ